MPNSLRNASISSNPVLHGFKGGKRKPKSKVQQAASTAAGRIAKVKDNLMNTAGSLVTDQINKRILGRSSVTGNYT